MLAWEEHVTKHNRGELVRLGQVSLENCHYCLPSSLTVAVPLVSFLILVILIFVYSLFRLFISFIFHFVWSSFRLFLILLILPSLYSSVWLFFLFLFFCFFFYFIAHYHLTSTSHDKYTPWKSDIKWTNRCTLSDKFRTHQQGCLMNDDYPKLHFITVVIPALTLRGKAMIDYWLYIIAQDIISVMEVKRRWLVNGLWRHYMSLLIRFKWREVIGQLVRRTIVTSFLRR